VTELLYYVKYDPVRTTTDGVSGMRHSSPMFTRIGDAMEYARLGTMTNGYSFKEYAVIEFSDTDRVIVQGTTDIETN